MSLANRDLFRHIVIIYIFLRLVDTLTYLLISCLLINIYGSFVE